MAAFFSTMDVAACCHDPPPCGQSASHTAAADFRRALQGLLFTAGLLVLVVASFWSLDLQWAQFFSMDAARRIARFLGEFFPPDLQASFVRQVVVATWETLAMSALGTVLAAAIGLALALPASRLHAGASAWARSPTRLLLNALRSVPELVWASLLIELVASVAGSAEPPFGRSRRPTLTPDSCPSRIAPHGRRLTHGRQLVSCH